MEAIILAGGRGTRLLPVISRCEALAPIDGRLFLEILLERLELWGFTHVVLSLGYMSEAITGHFEGHNSNLTLDFVVEEQLLGTGGAVRLALARCNNDHIFVFNGDTFIDLEVDKVQSSGPPSEPDCRWAQC